MVEHNKKIEQIRTVVKPINDYFLKDFGGISIIDFSENNILTLCFSGSCSKCKKNNKHLKCVINEMFKEALPGLIKEIKYVSENDHQLWKKGLN